MNSNSLQSLSLANSQDSFNFRLEKYTRVMLRVMYVVTQVMLRVRIFCEVKREKERRKVFFYLFLSGKDCLAFFL